MGAASTRLSRSTLSLLTLSSRAKGSSQASRDELWQRDTDAIFAAGSRSHQVKIIFLQKCVAEVLIDYLDIIKRSTVSELAPCIEPNLKPQP